MTEWIFPYNEEGADKFRVNDALYALDRIEWVQKVKNIDIGDIAYLYQAAPVKAIRWKCKVTDVGRAESKIDDRAFSGSGVVYSGPFLELERIYEYPHWEQFSLCKLKEHGYCGNMQSPSRVKSYADTLAEYIHRTDKIQQSEEELTKIARETPIHELKKLAKKYSGKNPQVTETETKQYKRNEFIAEYAKRRACGLCELCRKKAPFLKKNGEPYLEIHHIKWLCDGGADSIQNTVALCPNCHRKMHNAPETADIHYLESIAK